MGADPQQNPYQPPRAPVADVEDAPTEGRPRLINVAVGLIAIAVVAGFLNMLLIMQGALTVEQIGAPIIGTFISALVAAWITYKIWRGRNWARILLLIMVALGLALTARQFPVLVQMSFTVASIFVVRMVMLLSALGILFLSSAKRWYSQPR